MQKIRKGHLTLADGSFANITRPVYFLRHIERFPHNVPYPDMVDLLKRTLDIKLFRGKTGLVLDATGCGLPVADMFKRAKVGVPVTRVVITGGHNTNYDKDTESWRVPKQTLISTMQVLLQNGRLKIAKDIRDADKLTKELLEFQVRITDSGRDVYGTWRDGQHDDLVFAVALACWLGERISPPFFSTSFVINDNGRGGGLFEKAHISSPVQWVS